VVPEALTELVPREVTVPSWVGLPPVKSGATQLPCCVQNPLPVVALCNNQLALHRTKPVVRLEWVRAVREGRRVASQEIRTPITGLRWRWRRWLGMDLLQSPNGVVQCHTRFLKTNRMHNYMYARIKFHTYSDFISE
jgi:hypothetical protein